MALKLGQGVSREEAGRWCPRPGLVTEVRHEALSAATKASWEVGPRGSEHPRRPCRHKEPALSLPTRGTRTEVCRCVLGEPGNTQLLGHPQATWGHSGTLRRGPPAATLHPAFFSLPPSRFPSFLPFSLSFIFCLFRAAPTAYGGSQARGLNRSCSCQPPPQPRPHWI